MKIISVNYKWNKPLSKRKATDCIIIHHRAGNGDVQSLHSGHLATGYAGIGYNFYVRKNGEVYQGRPIDCVGAHTINYNSKSVGICFEGNYETTDTSMPDAQFNSGAELIQYVQSIYPSAKVIRHKDVYNTACPGKHFPFQTIINAAQQDTSDISAIVNQLANLGLVTDKSGMIKEMSDYPGCRLYWVAKKLLAYIKKLDKTSKRNVKEYTSPNDIAWELSHRGIVTDTDGFIEELIYGNLDSRLYWLSRKGVTYIRKRD